MGIDGSEPYLILNLEVYHETKGTGGAHCDFVYILSKDDRFEVYLVELKEINEVSKKNIRKSFQGKFSQTLRILKNELTSILGLESPHRVQYYGVIAVPVDNIYKIGSLIRRDKTLLGELRSFNGAWVTSCGQQITVKVIPLK